MKLLTYNIHHWEGSDGRVDAARVTEVIRQSGADVVALNEVFHPAAAQPGDPPLLEAMARTLDMAYLFGETLPFDPHAGLPAPYGNALLTRCPILSAQSHLTVGLPGREQRGFLRAVLDVGAAQPLAVYVIHLDHRHEEARMAQLKSLMALIARFGEHLHLVLGDFNALTAADAAVHDARPGRENLSGGQIVPHLLRAGYTDAYAAAGDGPPETWPTSNPSARIDYAFLTPTLTAALRSCRRWDSPLARLASDHFPVLIELALP